MIFSRLKSFKLNIFMQFWRIQIEEYEPFSMKNNLTLLDNVRDSNFRAFFKVFECFNYPFDSPIFR